MKQSKATVIPIVISGFQAQCAHPVASTLDAVECTEESIRILKDLVAENPKDLDAITMLGDVHSGRKMFADCAETYDRAVEALPADGRNNWVQHYFPRHLP